MSTSFRFSQHIPNSFAFLSILVFALLIPSTCAALDIGSVDFAGPTDNFLRYHIAVNVTNPEAASQTVTSVSVNGASRENFAVFVDGVLSKDNSVPEGAKACIRFTHPWENSAEHDVEVTAGSEGSDPLAVKTKAAAPSSGGYWNPAWRSYQVLRLIEEAGLDRTNEPVTIQLNFIAEQMRDPAMELRLVAIAGPGQYAEIPFQILETTSVETEEDKYPDTVSCKILFYASVPAKSIAYLLAFHNNPEAIAPESAVTDLTVAGEGLGLTIENPYYKITLAEQSGQINGIFVKQGIDKQLSHNGNAIHWNPGCYAPPRPWGHTYDWNPPEGKSEKRGPLVFEFKRWGILPQLPEVWVGVTYRFYAHTPYVLMSSTIDIREDIDVLALRNDEMVFEPQLFSQLGWRDDMGAIHTKPLGQDPDLEKGYSHALPADTPWLCLFQPEEGYGFGSLRLAYSSASTSAAEAVHYNEVTHVTDPSTSLVYWYRGLVYHFFPAASNTVHYFTKVNAGSMYHETNAYLPFPLGGVPSKPLETIDEAYMRLKHPLRVSCTNWGRDDFAAVGQRD